MIDNPICQSLAGTLAALALVLGLFLMLSYSPHAANADSHTPTTVAPSIASCTIVKQAGVNIQFQCTDVLGNVIPAGQITVEPQVIVSEIIKNVPGPTVTATATVKVPGPIRTIRPPQATRTVTVIRPQVTVTKTLPPPPRATRTLTSAPETTTITASPTETPSRQTGTNDGTVRQGRTFFSLDINPRDGKITAGEAGLGILAILGIIGLFYLGLYLGYYLGFKNKEKDDTHFMRALRDSILTR